MGVVDVEPFEFGNQVRVHSRLSGREEEHRSRRVNKGVRAVIWGIPRLDVTVFERSLIRWSGSFLVSGECSADFFL